MIRHEFLDDDLRDRAIEYVLGTLADGEAHAVGLHLPQCEVCRRCVDDIREVSREIVLAGPRRAPPTRAWEKIAARIGAAEASSPIARAIPRARRPRRRTSRSSVRTRVTGLRRAFPASRCASSRSTSSTTA